MMIQTLLGKKLKITQGFTQDGRRVPLTVLEIGPCVVTQLKTKEKDGYMSAQLLYGEKKKVNKALKGHLKGANVTKAPLLLEEVSIEKNDDVTVGKVIKVGDVFQKGDHIAVSGTSKGKGFTGVVKRYGFAGGPKTHGQSDRHRAPGSIGNRTTPGRVFKGKRMAGRSGGETVTVGGLEVFDIDIEKNLLFVRGLVPGHIRSLIRVSKGKI